MNIAASLAHHATLTWQPMHDMHYVMWLILPSRSHMRSVMEFTKLYVLVCLVILLATQGLAVDITYLESAKSKGAVCLDGSALAYRFDKGVGEGANN
ncbi:hypothetical protein LguiB_028395 [Lonicera macranthoides]